MGAPDTEKRRLRVARADSNRRAAACAARPMSMLALDGPSSKLRDRTRPPSQMTRGDDAANGRQINVLTNWFAELQ
jgi:hypothetical protein